MQFLDLRGFGSNGVDCWKVVVAYIFFGISCWMWMRPKPNANGLKFQILFLFMLGMYVMITF